MYENVQFTLTLSGKLLYTSKNYYLIVLISILIIQKITIKIIFQKENSDKFENMINKVDCKFEVER